MKRRLLLRRWLGCGSTRLPRHIPLRSAPPLCPHLAFTRRSFTASAEAAASASSHPSPSTSTSPALPHPARTTPLPPSLLSGFPPLDRGDVSRLVQLHVTRNPDHRLVEDFDDGGTQPPFICHLTLHFHETTPPFTVTSPSHSSRRKAKAAAKALLCIQLLAHGFISHADVELVQGPGRQPADHPTPATAGTEPVLSPPGVRGTDNVEKEEEGREEFAGEMTVSLHPPPPQLTADWPEWETDEKGERSMLLYAYEQPWNYYPWTAPLLGLLTPTPLNALTAPLQGDHAPAKEAAWADDAHTWTVRGRVRVTETQVVAMKQWLVNILGPLPHSQNRWSPAQAWKDGPRKYLLVPVKGPEPKEVQAAVSPSAEAKERWQSLSRVLPSGAAPVEAPSFASELRAEGEKQLAVDWELLAQCLIPSPAPICLSHFDADLQRVSKVVLVDPADGQLYVQGKVTSDVWQPSMPLPVLRVKRFRPDEADEEQVTAKSAAVTMPLHRLSRLEQRLWGVDFIRRANLTRMASPSRILSCGVPLYVGEESRQPPELLALELGRKLMALQNLSAAFCAHPSARSRQLHNLVRLAMPPRVRELVVERMTPYLQPLRPVGDTPVAGLDDAGRSGETERVWKARVVDSALGLVGELVLSKLLPEALQLLKFMGAGWEALTPTSSPRPLDSPPIHLEQGPLSPLEGKAEVFVRETLPVIERFLHYTFRQPRLLLEAFAHPSGKLSVEAEYGNFDNRRLEMLGDCVLGFVQSQELAKASKAKSLSLTAAALNDACSSVSCNGTLGALMQGLGLDALIIAEDVARTSGIAADALEALMGAVYVDGGMDARVVTRVWNGIVHTDLTKGHAWLTPKKRLHEHGQLPAGAEGRRQAALHNDEHATGQLHAAAAS